MKVARRHVGLLYDRWRHHLSPHPQFRHGTGWEGNILQPPAPVVSAVTTYKTFGPTDLTSAYSLRNSMSIGDRPRNLESRSSDENDPPRWHSFTKLRHLVNGSAETVRNVIRHAGYSSRVAGKKPFISLQNQKKPLEFAKTHQLKTDNFWKKVIFSEESKFNIFGSDGRRTVWRKPNAAFYPKNLRPTVKHGGGSVMAQNEIVVVPDFHKRILFSDEAHFWLNGYVNKQNCRIWSEANPQVYVETPLHPEKLTVWCALWAGGITGPYFFKNDDGHNVTVNGDRYRAMITYFFIPKFNNHDVQELWFQQDGATCHTARATIDLWKDTFSDRLISRFGPVNWPPRSCGLTPLDYFLWGYVKSLVYADKPQTLDHLEDTIHRVISDIRPQMLEKVIENWTSRLDYIRASRGRPMPEIIFKM
ncbi:uncharacterized protein TNCV_1373911 [Trichonephila clavipes]|nr:uncharacterized protein TNCV_1373911 [Trichonephila clavipes]